MWQLTALARSVGQKVVIGLVIILSIMLMAVGIAFILSVVPIIVLAALLMMFHDEVLK